MSKNAYSTESVLPESGFDGPVDLDAETEARPLRERLQGLGTVEDFLTFFGVAADPDRLAPNRMALLRLLHRTLNDLEADQATPAESFERCNQVLTEAYGRCAAGETLRRQRTNFVSLQSLHRPVRPRQS